MISNLLLGLGLVCVIEGLVLALAPSRLEELVAMLKELGPDRLRLLGLGAMALGIFLVYLSG